MLKAKYILIILVIVFLSTSYKIFAQNNIKEDPFDTDLDLGAVPNELADNEANSSNKENEKDKPDLENADEFDTSNSEVGAGELPEDLNEDKLTINGIIYEDFYSTLNSNPDNSYWGNYLKCRIKINKDVNENVNVHVEGVYANMLGEQNTFILMNNYGFINDGEKEAIATLGNMNYDFNQNNIVDQAYVSLKHPLFNVKVGKHVIAWGAGYLFNPTNRVSFIPIFDPTLEYPGTAGLTYSLRFTDMINLKGYFSLEDRTAKKYPVFKEQKFQNIAYGAKLQGNFPKIDIGISFIQELFYDALYFPEPNFIHSRYLGLDFSADINTIGFYAEGTYKIPEKRENRNNEKWDEKQLDTIVGLDYTFESGLGIRLEYYRQGMGAYKKENYDISEVLTLQKYILARDYLYAGINMVNIVGYLSYSLGTLGNMNDYSFIIFPELSYDIFQDVELKIGAYVFLGDKGTEFNGRLPYFDYITGNATIKHIYHHTLYSKLRVYF